MPAGKVLMIEPKNFYSNPETLHDNFFQLEANNLTADSIHSSVEREFHSLKDALVQAGIDVLLYQQDDKAETPDAVYPNNWFSTHPEKIFVLYPMKAENRRQERRPKIIADLQTRYPSSIDLSVNENRNLFLEGTGSLVLDHSNKIAYASLSPRTDSNVLFEWCRRMNYDWVVFHSYDMHDRIIYHTNVMMCIGERFAVACLDAVHSLDEKRQIRSRLIETGHELVDISREQMHSFCANCLELQNESGKSFLVMSDQAFRNFRDEQLEILNRFSSIIHVDLSTIETIGGGGARCMLAEMF